MKWIQTETEIEGLIAESHQKRVLVLKHSTRCPISSRAYTALQKAESELQAAVSIVGIDVIDNRSISMSIAQKLQVQHESPQCILVCKGKVEEHFSHFEITAERLLKLKRLD